MVVVKCLCPSRSQSLLPQPQAQAQARRPNMAGLIWQATACCDCFLRFAFMLVAIQRYVASPRQKGPSVGLLLLSAFLLLDLAFSPSVLSSSLVQRREYLIVKDNRSDSSLRTLLLFCFIDLRFLMEFGSLSISPLKFKFQLNFLKIN